MDPLIIVALAAAVGVIMARMAARAHRDNAERKKEE
jgi:hypothetical protein